MIDTSTFDIFCYDKYSFFSRELGRFCVFLISFKIPKGPKFDPARLIKTCITLYGLLPLIFNVSDPLIDESLIKNVNKQKKPFWFFGK